MLDELPSVVHQEAQKNYQQLLNAIDKYQQQYAPAPVSNAPTIWRYGNARLLDYGRHMPSPAKAYTLLVPSLINRHYILDLSSQRSFIQYLAKQGIYPLVLDWDEPGIKETSFNMADYVTHILSPAIEFLHRTIGQPIHLLGYCLGGILTLAAAQLKPQHIASLGLLATPWNFHSNDSQVFKLGQQQLQAIEKSILSSTLLPPFIFQWLFMLRQPFALQHKFLKFGQASSQQQVEDFVQVEHWVNDHVPMASKAAVDCLIRWGQMNQLYTSMWRVTNTTISPKKIKVPSFLAIPNQDTIVPTGCAQALANLLPKADICYPDTGHVGMMIGKQALQDMWEPYTKFVRRNT